MPMAVEEKREGDILALQAKMVEKSKAARYDTPDLVL
jgi:hypothetical protein